MDDMTLPDEQERRVKFADPARSPARKWSHADMKRQADFLNYLWAGMTPSEAAEAANSRLKDILFWRKVDQSFDQKVRNQLELQREMILPDLEANMYKQAMKDSIGAGRLAFDLAKVLDPETYGKKTAEITLKPPAKKPEEFGISEWFAAPTPLDAEYRSLDEPEPDDD